MKYLLFFLLVLIMTINSTAQVAEQDSLALVAIYNSTDGVNWFYNTNWLEETMPVEEWAGVVVQNNRVVQLNLGYNNLYGPMPEETGDLDSLSILDLTFAHNLSLPASIGNLVTLDTLLLTNAEIDTLPAETGNLHDLKLLVFSYTQIRYLPEDLSGLFSLETLICEHGALKHIPASIGTLSNLKYLLLSVNDIDNLPESIGNCTNLIDLYVNANNIPEVPASIGNLVNLESLVLGGNELDYLPEEIYTLTNLTFLNFAANGLDTISPSIGNLTNLQNFQFFNNNFRSIPEEIGNCVNLSYINGYSNKLNSLPESLLNLPLINIPNEGKLFLIYNALTFEDIEPLAGITEFEYYSQDSIGTTTDTILPSNSPFRIECLTGGDHNIYQWMKNGNVIEGANSYFVEFPSLAFADSGIYHCEVTNSVATGLTLYSRPVNLKVEGTLGTGGSNDAGDFMIYPNPASSNVSIITSETLQGGIIVSIFNTGGQLIKRQKLSDPLNLSLDTSSLEKGLFLIEIRSSQGIMRKKLIIE